MEQEQTLETRESLRIIEEMIQKARFNFSRGSFYFILWGLLLMAAALVQQFLDGGIASIGWPIAGVIGGIGTWVYGARTESSGELMHLDKVYNSIWVVFLVTLVFIIVALVGTQTDPNGFILIITGLPTYLTGHVLKFKPLQAAGVLFWVAGMLAIFLLPEYSSIIYAGSMLFGYVIPGFIMKGMR